MWHVLPWEIISDGKPTGKFRMTATNYETGAEHNLCDHHHATSEDAVACPEAREKSGLVTGVPDLSRGETVERAINMPGAVFRFGRKADQVDIQVCRRFIRFSLGSGCRLVHPDNIADITYTPAEDSPDEGGQLTIKLHVGQELYYSGKRAEYFLKLLENLSLG